jgi:hypothetical protein
MLRFTFRIKIGQAEISVPRHTIPPTFEFNNMGTSPESHLL